jgi:hypothetical protein
VEAYSIKDIVLLMNILMIRHRLSCSLHRLKQNKSHIYIKNKSMPLLLAGIRPFISSFRGRRPLQLYMQSAFSSQPTLQRVRGVHTGQEPGSPNITPVKSYANPDILKKEIIRDNKDQVGIYR